MYGMEDEPARKRERLSDGVAADAAALTFLTDLAVACERLRRQRERTAALEERTPTSSSSSSSEDSVSDASLDGSSTTFLLFPLCDRFGISGPTPSALRASFILIVGRQVGSATMRGSRLWLCS